jgi:hypothetical protein
MQKENPPLKRLRGTVRFMHDKLSPHADSLNFNARQALSEFS